MKQRRKTNMKKGLLIGAGAIAGILAVAGIGYGASKVIDATCTPNTGYDPDDSDIDEIVDDEFEEELVDDDPVDAFAEAARDAGADVVEF
jgi:hypothetical protein